MSTIFKRKWAAMVQKHDAILDVQTLDFQINDYTLRMAEAETYQEWERLYHERERTQIFRDHVAQYQ